MKHSRGALLMKKLLICIIILTYCLSTSSCSRREPEIYYEADLEREEEIADEAHFSGLLKGEYEAFEYLWKAIGETEVLKAGDIWKTEHFSIAVDEAVLPGVTSNNYEDMPGIKFTLTTTNITMNECILDGRFFFWGCEKGADVQCEELLFTGDDFFWSYARPLDGVDRDAYKNGQTCQAMIELDENCDEVLLIVVVENCAYKARYSPSNT